MNPREIIRWCLFDSAKSSCAAIIYAVTVPVYLVSVIAGNAAGLVRGRATSFSMASAAGGPNMKHCNGTS